ncbi:MAG: hypothetical protein ACXWTY_14730 [Methylobacter sp.]
MESEDPTIEKESFELINNAMIGLNQYCQMTINDLAKLFFVKPDFLSVLLAIPQESPKLTVVGE